MQDVDEPIAEVSEHDDGTITLTERVASRYGTAVPRDLLRSPPPWVLKLVERGATYEELALEVGEVARRTSRPDKLGELYQLVEQIAVTDEGRQSIDRVLAPGFISRLVAASTSDHHLIFVPAMVVYENAEASGHAAWINPHEDELVDPVGVLQQLYLDQAISAVWQHHARPFLELFLFDGPDLQGRFTRFARVKTSVAGLPIALDSAALDDQSRSLLGSVRSLPGRRFSAKQQLLNLVTSSLSQHAQAPFGTIALIQPVRFSWDGYELWQASASLPKTGALRVRIDFRIDDVSHGQFVGSQTWDTVFRRNGSTSPIEWVTSRVQYNLPQPWGGSIDTSNPRWNRYISRERRRVLDAIAVAIGQLAGTAPGALRILPGRSNVVPTPPASHWGLIEIGRTDDDATIVLSP